MFANAERQKLADTEYTFNAKILDSHPRPPNVARSIGVLQQFQPKRVV
jgi:hypothetical protein